MYRCGITTNTRLHYVLGWRQVQALLRLVGEKLDLVRSSAGTALVAIVHNASGKYGIPGVPLLARLREFVPKDDTVTRATSLLDDDDSATDQHVNWAAAGSCFPTLVPILGLAPYVDSIMSGLVTSVGGLSESVVGSARLCDAV